MTLRFTARTAGVDIIGVAAACFALSACIAPVREHGHPENLRICDTVIPTGALLPAVATLQKEAPPPAGPPKESQLPSVLPSTRQHFYSVDSYVRTSPSCDAGAIVQVAPAANAMLTVVVRAQDGKIAALGLHLNGPVTVEAWVGDHYQGSLAMNP
jgi:hypothetical protein